MLAVDRLQAAELLPHQRFDAVVLLPEALERGEDRRPVGREIGRAVVGQHGHAVLRQQPLANEPDGGVDPLVGPLEAPAAEDEEEDALILGRDGGVGRLRPPEGGPPGRGGSGVRACASNRRISCGIPSSLTVKSSFLRSVTGLPLRSTTRMSTGTSVVRLRMVGGACWLQGGSNQSQ